ncbi:MAG: hypothetical protein AAF696_18290, partial [Bacteroidota bacterium]
MQIEDFLLKQSEQQQEIIHFLHQLLHQEWALEMKMRYQVPFYFKKSWICYLNPLKNGGIEWAFPRGNELSNAQGLLDAKGRKQVMGINIMHLSELPLQTSLEILQEAVLL